MRARNPKDMCSWFGPANAKMPHSPDISRLHVRMAAIPARNSSRNQNFIDFAWIASANRGKWNFVDFWDLAIHLKH